MIGGAQTCTNTRRRATKKEKWKRKRTRMVDSRGDVVCDDVGRRGIGLLPPSKGRPVRVWWESGWASKG